MARIARVLWVVILTMTATGLVPAQDPVTDLECSLIAADEIDLNWTPPSPNPLNNVSDDFVTSLNPVGYWRLGEAALNTIAIDETGLSDGDYLGGAVGGVRGALDGSTNTAADFPGASGDFVEIPHDPAYLLDEGTISFWLRADNLSGRRGLFSKDSNGRDTGGQITIFRNGSRIRVQLETTTLTRTLETSNNVVEVRNWHHVAVSFGAG